jgi:hypothetical protein
VDLKQIKAKGEQDALESLGVKSSGLKGTLGLMGAGALAASLLAKKKQPNPANQLVYAPQGNLY